MTTKQRTMALLLALLVLAALTLSCDDWDGMDRRSWPGPTPTCTVCRPDLPPGQHTAPAGETGAAAAGD